MPNGNIGRLLPAVDVLKTFEEFEAKYADLGMSRHALKRLWDKEQRDKLYLSDYYQVAVDKDPPHSFPGAVIWHLSIKRVDRQPIMDWRDLQAIKTALCGAEAEGIQLFTAESRVVDTSNQYHLWVFM